MHSGRLLLVSLVLPTFIVPGAVILFGSLLNLEPNDLFPILNSQARLGFGLLAAGIAANLLVAFLLTRLGPRWWTEALATWRARFKHPWWDAAATLWAQGLFVAVFIALAFLPREILIGWLTVAGSRGGDIGLVFDGFFVGSSLIALLPLFLVRSIDRRR
jgi:hypothetical protein